MKHLSFIAALLASPATVLAANGGQCAGDWGLGCICLDEGVCHSYGGIAYPGTPGDYPCPWDPDNIMGCYVQPCPGVGGVTQCVWRPGCWSENAAKTCPGGDDFICCNHLWIKE